MVLYFIYILNMEKIKINCPEGYEVDKDKSTFEEIVFKPKVFTEYWEYIGRNSDFTKGKIYKCLDPKNINKADNFIDDVGDENGHSPNNTKFFKPSTKEAFDEQNKPKFEIGKWYKFIWEWDKRLPYYGKFKSNSTGNYSWYEWFREDGSNYQAHPSFNASELGNYSLLTDLSEIQKYLPDGHEDKIIKYTLEEGEYYKVVEDGNFWMIGKVAKGGIEESTFANDGKTIDLRCNISSMINSFGEYHKHLDYWCYYSELEGEVTRNFTKLSKDSDEVKWLEICNKAGKYLTKEEALKPKLPTKWEDLGDYNGYYTHGSDVSKQDTNLSTSGSDNWPTREYAKASIALCKLIRLRDIYNGEWKPNWQSYGEYKYVICYFNDIIQIDSVAKTKILLHFKTRELRDEFRKNFKELIEEAKLLL